MTSTFKAQAVDQTGKGALLALFIYIAISAGLATGLIVVLVPVVAFVLAWLSTKVGDPMLASFLAGTSKFDEPVEDDMPDDGGLGNTPYGDFG